MTKNSRILLSIAFAIGALADLYRKSEFYLVAR